MPDPSPTLPSLLVSTPTSLGLLSFAPSTTSKTSAAVPSFTPVHLPTRLTSAAPLPELESSWSTNGRTLQVIPIPADSAIFAGTATGTPNGNSTVFTYSYRGKRMTDLVIPSTSSSFGIEKIACLGGLANGRRDLVLARLGEVVIVKVEEVRSSSGSVGERVTKVLASYPTSTNHQCTALIASAPATAETDQIVIAGFSNGEILVIRRPHGSKGVGAGGTRESMRIDLKEWCDGRIPSSLHLHPSDTSILILPLSSSLLLVNLASSRPQPAGQPITLSGDQFAVLPCLPSNGNTRCTAMSRDGRECAVAGEGQQGEVVLISMEEPDAPKKSFKVGAEISSVEYMNGTMLAIGTVDGKLLLKDLEVWETPAQEVMSTEGESIMSLRLQPGDPTTFFQDGSAAFTSHRTTSHASDPPRPPTRSSSHGNTSSSRPATELPRSASTSVVGALREGDRSNRVAARNDDLRRSVLAKERDGAMKSRHSVAGPYKNTSSNKSCDGEGGNTTLPATTVATATSRRRVEPAAPRSTTTAMSRALSRAEALAQDASRSTAGRTASSSSSSSSSRRVSVAPSEIGTLTRTDVTLPSMTISADSSVATVRPSRSGPPTAAEQDEGVDLEADELWAREFVRQQDKLEERQWDEWAGALVEMQDARERFGHVKGGVADEELNEVERLRLEVVEVQMRSIRMVRDFKSELINAISPLQHQLQQTHEIIARQQQEIESLHARLG